MTSLQHAVVLVTGANGGLGTEFVRQALDRGAAKVYASARTPKDWGDDRVVPLALDVTDPASVAAAAERASDTTVLINNAGIGLFAPSLLETPVDDLRRLLETNTIGLFAVTQAFAPALRRARAARFAPVQLRVISEEDAQAVRAVNGVIVTLSATLSAKAPDAAPSGARSART